MKFSPLTEEQIQEQGLLPDGLYDYQVTGAEEKVSHAGNEYIKLTLRVRNEEGREGLIFTNLSLVKLLKHFCDANGLENEYKSGNIPAAVCINKNRGKVMIGREGEKIRPDGGTYPAKNIVRDYVCDPVPSANRDSFISDDIPF